MFIHGCLRSKGIVLTSLKSLPTVSVFCLDGASPSNGSYSAPGSVGSTKHQLRLFSTRGGDQ